MTFHELNKLNDEIATEYEILQVTKQNVFASIQARHEELHKAMESLAKTMEANTDDDDIDEAMGSMEHNDQAIPAMYKSEPALRPTYTGDWINELTRRSISYLIGDDLYNKPTDTKIDDQLDAISNDLDELLRSMEE